MTATYKLQAQDFVDAQFAHYNRNAWSRWSRRLLLGFAIFAALGFIFALIVSAGRELQSLLPLGAGAALWLLFLYGLPQYAGRKQFNSSPSSKASIDLCADDQGFAMKTATTDSRQAWANVARWTESKTVFLLYYSVAVFAIVPKRELTPEQTNEFRELLRRNVRAK
jgi:YcxB-like protein